MLRVVSVLHTVDASVVSRKVGRSTIVRVVNVRRIAVSDMNIRQIVGVMRTHLVGCPLRHCWLKIDLLAMVV